MVERELALDPLRHDEQNEERGAEPNSHRRPHLAAESVTPNRERHDRSNGRPRDRERSVSYRCLHDVQQHQTSDGHDCAAKQLLPAHDALPGTAMQATSIAPPRAPASAGASDPSAATTKASELLTTWTAIAG